MKTTVSEIYFEKCIQRSHNNIQFAIYYIQIHLLLSFVIVIY